MLSSSTTTTAGDWLDIGTEAQVFLKKEKGLFPSSSEKKFLAEKWKRGSKKKVCHDLLLCALWRRLRKRRER